MQDSFVTNIGGRTKVALSKTLAWSELLNDVKLVLIKRGGGKIGHLTRNYLGQIFGIRWRQGSLKEGSVEMIVLSTWDKYRKERKTEDA